MFDIYGKGQHLSDISFYYNNLLKYTYPLNIWLGTYNLLYSRKFKLIFIKILLEINITSFNLKRKEFKCFYSKFFYIGKFLFFRCKNLISTSLGKQFFRFFSKLLLFIKYHKTKFWRTDCKPVKKRYGNNLRS